MSTAFSLGELLDLTSVLFFDVCVFFFFLVAHEITRIIRYLILNILRILCCVIEMLDFASMHSYSRFRGIDL